MGSIHAAFNAGHIPKITPTLTDPRKATTAAHNGIVITSDGMRVETDHANSHPNNDLHSLSHA